MRYFIIVGEASGDLHAANLIKEIKTLDPQAQFQGWGGDLMQQQGAHILKHYKELAFMGFWEVFKNLPTILANIKTCKTQINTFKPNVMIFVDYPGFNLRIAEYTKKQNIPNYYYISPQVWAWKENRVKKMKKIIDHLLVILPFEEKWYAKKHQYKVTFVGHPLIDAIENFKINTINRSEFLTKYNLNNKPIIALLPGSRKQEITTKLPIMISIIESYPDYQFIVAGAPSLSKEFYGKFITKNNLSIIFNDTYNLLNNATAALVTSGTATLETALFNVPQIVCYKGSKISYYIAKKLIKVKFISLVNLIVNKQIVKELIQNELTKSNLKKELNYILEPKNSTQIKTEYEVLKTLCGGIGASKNTAKYIITSEIKK